MTVTSSGQPDARVIQTEYGFEVVPARVPKHADQFFILRNNTQSDISVMFPAELQMSPSSGTIGPHDNGQFTIGHPDIGVYAYKVEILLTDERSRRFTLRASGGSDPEIIIDF